jgi:hypothetical protein
MWIAAPLAQPSFIDHLVTRRPQRIPVFALPLRNTTPDRQPLTMPGSTGTALAVKTERLPAYGLPHYAGR